MAEVGLSENGAMVRGRRLGGQDVEEAVLSRGAGLRAGETRYRRHRGLRHGVELRRCAMEPVFVPGETRAPQVGDPAANVITVRCVTLGRGRAGARRSQGHALAAAASACVEWRAASH